MGEENPLTALVPNLKGIDPDDAFSSVPYEKGHTFLFYLETLVGKGNMDRFLREYIAEFKYQSINTNIFKDFFLNFFSQKKELDEVDWDSWLYKPGMPPIIPDYDTSLVEECANLAQRWLDWEVDDDCAFINNSPFKHSDVTSISPRQVRMFLGILFENEKTISEKKCRFMGDVYGFNSVQNCEIKFKWLRLCIKVRVFHPQVQIAIEFINSQGRMKYVRPIYRDLYAWEESRPLAVENYMKTRDQMMHVTATQLKKDLHIEGDL